MPCKKTKLMHAQQFGNERNAADDSFRMCSVATDVATHLTLVPSAAVKIQAEPTTDRTAHLGDVEHRSQQKFSTGLGARPQQAASAESHSCKACPANIVHVISHRRYSTSHQVPCAEQVANNQQFTTSDCLHSTLQAHWLPGQCCHTNAATRLLPTNNHLQLKSFLCSN